jgi:hypothetical protein
MTDAQSFWDAQSEWSQETFGLDTERGPIGALKHLAKEAVEAQQEPWNLEEYVDCLFLTFDATRRAGYTLEDLLNAAFVKLAKNKTRIWPKPTKSDEPIEHQRGVND